MTVPWDNHVVLAVCWSTITIASYVLAKRLYRRWPRWWTSPLLLAPLGLMAIILTAHITYRDYIRGTHWLVTLLGPAMVAFAVPIYQQRELIRRRWPQLLVGMLVGSATAMTSAWGLATLLGLDGTLRASLVPRSISTPFAMVVSGQIGGIPELTALFVVFTGVLGAALGEAMLLWLPLRSVLARGALFGMGAHAIGAAKAYQIDREEGSIAGLMMVLVGILNVLAAPLLALFLK